MSRSVCFGKSSAASQKQPATELTSAGVETHKPDETVGKQKVTDKPRSLPADAQPSSVQVSYQENIKSGEVLNTAECAPKESISIAPRIDEQAESTAATDKELKMEDLKKSQPPDSAGTGGRAQASPPVEPLPMHEASGEQDQTIEEDVGDEDLRAPVELKMKFLRALRDKDLQLASKLCQMILIYEPDNPEASEFLPLIQKLLEEQEAEESSEDGDEEEEEEEEDDDDNDDSGMDEESSCSSSGSSSCLFLSSSSP